MISVHLPLVPQLQRLGGVTAKATVPEIALVHAGRLDGVEAVTDTA
jgi:hypothetical protein